LIFYQKVNNKTYFYQDQFVQSLPEGNKATWFFDNMDTGSFYVQSVADQKVEDYLPYMELGEWSKVNNKINSQKKALETCKIRDEDMLALLPESLIKEYYSFLNKATKAFVEKNKVNSFNMHVSRVASLIEKIKRQRVRVNFKNLLEEEDKNPRNKRVLKKIKEGKRVIDYDVLGSRTGRLTNKSGSIPILTLKKELRSIIEPQNDLFAEFDYNAAEARVLLALCGVEQPQDDIHDWNIQNVFRGLGTREEAKVRLFSWLYNPNSDDRLLNRTYDRKKVLKKYYDGKAVKNIFGREIESDDFHALNYLIQSTCADLVLEQAVKLDNLLKNKKSKIAFIVHDSIVVDVTKEDFNMMTAMLNCFADTRLGKFKVNVSGGKTFGNMRKI
tara:strand:+ start:4656 stop:5813 length:1158 start_codon:yes stop_codon:yes gene_type:complete